jgi:hypothetical protein
MVFKVLVYSVVTIAKIFYLAISTNNKTVETKIVETLT